MACRRCHGFMIEECHSDLLLEHTFWRCINCGAIFDPEAEAHPPEPLRELQVAGGRHRRAPRPGGMSTR